MHYKILVLYYSRGGSVHAMAKEIARGIEQVENCEALLRTVPSVAPVTAVHEMARPNEDELYVTLEDFEACDGLALGSPTRFGNMAASLKYFWDTSGQQWFSGALISKPAAVFTSTATMHSGQESTLLSMMVPLLHHGMIVVGIPASEPAVLSTTTGGSFYGATHYAGAEDNAVLSNDEITLCRALGLRLAEVATLLKRKQD